MSKLAKRFAIVSLAVLFATALLFVLPCTHGYMVGFFFDGGKDFLADFLNVANCPTLSLSHFNPYHSGQIYPPFAYVLFLPFVGLMPESGMTLSACHASPAAMLLGFVAVSLMSVVLFVSIRSLCRRFGLASWMAIALFLSGQVLWGIERGNVILLAVSGIFFFLSYYDSENPKLKLLAALGLSLAVALKVTPVLFGVLWLNKRHFRWLCLAGVITLATSFGPLLLSDYTVADNVKQLMDNVAAFEKKYSDICLSVEPSHILRMGFRQILCADVTAGWPFKVLRVARGISMTVGVCAVAMAAIGKMPLWQKLFLLAAGQIMINSAPQQYLLMLFIPALVALLASSEHTDAVAQSKSLMLTYVLMLYVVVMLPFPIYVFRGVCINFGLQSYLVLFGALVLIVKGVVKMLKPGVTE